MSTGCNCPCSAIVAASATISISEKTLRDWSESGRIWSTDASKVWRNRLSFVTSVSPASSIAAMAVPSTGDGALGRGIGSALLLGGRHHVYRSAGQGGARRERLGKPRIDG